MLDAFKTNGSSPPDHVRRTPDLVISGDFALYLIHGTSPAGHAWLSEHVPADAPHLGDAVAVAHRFIADIVRGAIADGFLVR